MGYAAVATFNGVPGILRKSHVMDLVTDQAIALFAGINVVPKRSYLAG